MTRRYGRAPLEPVMNVGLQVIDWGDGTQSLPQRDQRYRVGHGGPLLDADDCRGATACGQPARGVQGLALDCTCGGTVTDDAQRPAPLGRGLSTNAALGACRRL